MKIIKHFILFGIIWIIQLCICVRIPIQQVSDSFSIEELNKIKFLIKFGSLMERMSNLRTEGYKYELNEGMIRRPSDDAIMSFLGQFGLNFNEENPSENNPNNNME